MDKEYIEQLKVKYSFLTSEEIEVVYLIAKANFNYKYINSLKVTGLEYYFRKHVGYIIKNNNHTEEGQRVIVNDKDIDILFLLKKNKVSIKKIRKILSKLENIEIDYYPLNDYIISKTRSEILIKKLISYILMILSLGVMSYCLINIFGWKKEVTKVEKISTSVQKEVKIKEEEPPKKEEFVVEEPDAYFKYLNVSMMDVDFSKLKEQNKDVKGWIKVNGTNVNYPFVQGPDNNYYLKHTFDGSYNTKGWVYMDYRNDIDNLGKNTILYAHGLVNNGMFGSIRNVFKSNWSTNEENHIIKMSTENKNMLWEVISTYRIVPVTDYIADTFNTDEEYKKFLDTIVSRSEYNYGVSVNVNDKILTLSSCYDNAKRMVIHARLIAESDK